MQGVRGRQSLSQARAMCLTWLVMVKDCRLHSTRSCKTPSQDSRRPRILEDKVHGVQRGSHYILGGTMGLGEKCWVVSLHTPSRKPVFLRPSQSFISTLWDTDEQPWEGWGDKHVTGWLQMTGSVIPRLPGPLWSAFPPPQTSAPPLLTIHSLLASTLYRRKDIKQGACS